MLAGKAKRDLLFHHRRPRARNDKLTLKLPEGLACIGSDCYWSWVARRSKSHSGDNDDLGQSVDESVEKIFSAANTIEAGIMFWRCHHCLLS